MPAYNNNNSYFNFILNNTSYTYTYFVNIIIKQTVNRSIKARKNSSVISRGI